MKNIWNVDQNVVTPQQVQDKVSETQQPDPHSRNTRRKAQIDDNMEIDGTTLDLTDRELEIIQNEIVHLFSKHPKKVEPAPGEADLNTGNVWVKILHGPRM